MCVYIEVFTKYLFKQQIKKNIVLDFIQIQRKINKIEDFVTFQIYKPLFSVIEAQFGLVYPGFNIHTKKF